MVCFSRVTKIIAAGFLLWAISNKSIYAEVGHQPDIENSILDRAVSSAEAKPRRPESIGYQTVFFFTNRKVDIAAVQRAHEGNVPPLPSSDVFSEQLATGIAYGLAHISYPVGRKRGDTRYNGNPSSQNSYLSFKVTYYEVFSSWAELRQMISGQKDASKTRLIYVHGFKSTFASAAKQTAQMSLDLNEGNVSIFFSWPSNRTIDYWSPVGRLVQSYQSAVHNSIVSRPYVGAAVLEISSLAGPYRIIAHSMGADILGNALVTSYLFNTYAEPKRETKAPHAVLFVAPDISENDFTNELTPILTTENSRIAVYCTDDLALWASKLYHSSTRLGWCDAKERSLRGVDVVMVRGRMTDSLRHSYFLGSTRILDDMRKVLQGAKIKRNQTHFRYIDLQ